MSFDGMMIHHLCEEIESKIIDGRIDKIHQPERDELSIGIRSSSGSHNLFISVDSSIPYFTLNSLKKENPMQPPMFCMLLRKHLSGGKIISFKQIGYERVVVLTIESKNDFGELEEKKVFIEIMGKHSNIILTKEDFTIIDSIKRITPDMSRIRTILPGLKYTMLESDKISPEDSFESWSKLIFKQSQQQKIYKALYMSIEGFSPFYANALISMTEVNADLPVSTLSDTDLKALYDANQKLISISKPKGYMLSDKEKGYVSIYFIDTHLPHQNVEVFDSLCEGLEAFYGKSNRTLKLHQRLNDIRKAIQIKYDRSVSKKLKLLEEIKEAENAEHYKMLGELIYANLYQLSKGSNVITVLNYYSENSEMIDIPLDVRLDPNENAQSYFKKYNKLRTAQKTLETQIAETDEMIQYLENVLIHMQTVESASDIDELLNELADGGFIRKKYKKQKSKPSKPSVKHYKSSDGFDIFVGKNNYQNDYLTLKLASNKDLWFHTKVIPGSHVVIKTNASDVPDQTIIEAATIAAYFSKAKQSSNVPVDYTLVKYVSKPNGAKPGMVIYTHNKTIYVTPDEKLIDALQTS